jgi:hypothetical protein
VAGGKQHGADHWGSRSNCHHASLFFPGAILTSAKDEDLFAFRPINQLYLQSGLHRSPVCFQ